MVLLYYPDPKVFKKVWYVEVLITKANIPPNVIPNVSDIHTYTLRTLLRVYRRTDDGKKTITFNHRNMTTLFYSTFKISGNKVVLFLWLEAHRPRYNCFVISSYFISKYPYFNTLLVVTYIYNIYLYTWRK